jgi:hypothetical protein
MNNVTKNKLPNGNSIIGQKLFSKKIVNPKRDWHIILFIFAILIIASVGFDFYMYQKIVSGDMYVSVNKEELTIENLKANDLKKILDNFEVKKSAATTLKLENLVDPSL